MPKPPEQPTKPGPSGQPFAPAAFASQIGTSETAPVIQDYELLRRSGRGAYGEVWLARNVTGSLVALKVVTRGAFDHDRPFEREFEGIKRFEPISRSDPSQLAILHVGRGEGFFYYVMELADDLNAECGMRNAELKASSESSNLEAAHDDPKAGSKKHSPDDGTLIPHFAFRAPHSYVPHTLREDLKRHGRLPVSQCVTVGSALARALAHLHRCGLVHRDVKASNVIFVGGLPKLADIGLVTSVDATRSLVGTEGYIAPEGPGTPQADLYSLGKLLYEISTGCDRKEFPTLPADIATRPDREALIELNAIIMRACQFDPAQRYAQAEAMLAELELLQRGQSVQRKRRRSKGWTVLKRAGIAVAGLVALIAIIARLQRGTTPPISDPDGPPSTNAEANVLWDRGTFIIRGDRYQEYAQAYTNFHRAIELDPNYARPYVGLLELTREYVPSVGLTSPHEMHTIAQELQRLCPHLAATQVAQSISNLSSWNYPQARLWALKAITTDPNYEYGHGYYAYLLTMWGYPREARAQLAISEKLRPAKATVYRVLGQTYFVEREYTNAIAWSRKALECNPYEGVALYTIACAYRAMGDYSNWLRYHELGAIYGWAGDTPETRKQYRELRKALEEGGQERYWHEVLRQAEDFEFYWKAVAQLHLGNTNEALNLLQKSCAAHEHWSGSHDGPLTYLLLDADWDQLHKDKRFRAVLDKIGFTKVMPP